MKEIVKFLKPYKLKLGAVALMHAVAAITSLLMPYVMSLIVDEGIREQRIAVIIGAAAVMLVLAAVSLTTSVISTQINARITTGFSSSVREAAFKKINSLSPAQYSKFGSSGLLTRSTDDIFNIEDAASSLVYTVVTVPMMLVGGTVLSFISDPTLSLVFLIFVPPLILFVVFIVYPLRTMWDEADKYIDVQNKIVRERLSGLRVVRAFNSEAREHARAKSATEEMSKYMIRANTRSGFITPVTLLFLNLATVLMLWLGAMRVGSGEIGGAGAIIAAIQYVGLISNALLTLSWTIAWIPHLKVSIGRISEVLTLPKEDESAEDIRASAYDSARGVELNLSGVSFSYPDSSTRALTDISMHIGAGQTVAVIGGTGSGKSTLVRLLLAFYSPTAGEITLDGKSYSSLAKSEIRSAYSAALQRPMIFEGALRDNIAMGKRSAADSEILAAAGDLALSEFIAERREGLDYLLVGMGQNVSGGQKQRINMTRTAIRDASIYIFDDSFSALDYLTEKKVQKRLFERLLGKTKILVTQRISTALAAECIYVMDKGEIVGSGSHRELVRSCDVYREICRSQLGEEAVKGGDEA